MEEKTNYFRMDLSPAKAQTQEYLFFMVKFDNSHWFSSFSYCYSNDTNSCDDFISKSYYSTYKNKRSSYRKYYYEVPLKKEYNYIFIKVKFSLFGLIAWQDLTLENENSSHAYVVASTVIMYIFIAIIVIIVLGAVIIGLIKSGSGSGRLSECIENCEDKICCCLK